METPCEWAAKAINEKGQKFSLSLDGKSADVPLTAAEKHNIGGGYVAYQFGWTGPSGGNAPHGDGIYTVNNPSSGDTQLFLVYSSAGGTAYWAATITCQEG